MGSPHPLRRMPNSTRTLWKQCRTFLMVRHFWLEVQESQMCLLCIWMYFSYSLDIYSSSSLLAQTAVMLAMVNLVNMWCLNQQRPVLLSQWLLGLILGGGSMHPVCFNKDNAETIFSSACLSLWSMHLQKWFYVLLVEAFHHSLPVCQFFHSLGYCSEMGFKGWLFAWWTAAVWLMVKQAYPSSCL